MGVVENLLEERKRRWHERIREIRETTQAIVDEMRLEGVDENYLRDILDACNMEMDELADMIDGIGGEE